MNDSDEIPQPKIYKVETLDHMQFPLVQQPRVSQFFFAVKSVVDRLVAGLALLVLWPLIVVLILLVRWTSPGPGIFVQRRTGLGGKTFKMYKLRSMVQDAEQRGAQWSQPGDARVTRMGSFLRFTHLDELPQLYNVLRGDMALIGPRPERPEFVELLHGPVPKYLQRHAIRPGITGLAQIYLPPDETIGSVKKKVEYDLLYLENAGPLMDLQIALCTLIRILGFRYGTGPRWTGLNRSMQRMRRRSAQSRQNSRAASRIGEQNPAALAPDSRWSYAVVSLASDSGIHKKDLQLANCSSDSSISGIDMGGGDSDSGSGRWRAPK